MRLPSHMLEDASTTEEVLKALAAQADHERHALMMRGLVKMLATIFGRAEVAAMVEAEARRQASKRSRNLRELAVRKDVTAAVRFEVLQRDGFRCRYCGATPGEAHLRVDHVTPVSGGGTSDEGNLVTACERCNLGKGSREGVEPPRG